VKSAIFIIFQVVAVSLAFAVEPGERANDQHIVVTRKVAEGIAVQEFRKQTKMRLANVSVRSLKGDEQEWAFVLEDSAQLPRPGSELYVRVNKKTGKLTSYFGK